MSARKPYSGVGRWDLKTVNTFSRDSSMKIKDLLMDGWEPFAVGEGNGPGISYHFRKFILLDEEIDNG